ncbi:MAG: flagellar basal body P-ring protein FlgI [Candidatus Tectomicrobia bacterium]|nr:flagellar basal body P-ring protein FlgI [Candidatus Tectomicrobia bacterium]
MCSSIRSGRSNDAGTRGAGPAAEPPRATRSLPPATQRRRRASAAFLHLPLRPGVAACTALLLMLVLLGGRGAWAARLKDLVDIQGVRLNQLNGFGLVIGLNGTGDDRSTGFTFQTLANMLQRQGVSIDPNLIRTDNVAAVIVTAKLQPFAKAGTRLDVLVSSIGNATSLQGGTLLVTPLRGHDGNVYVLAQGPLSIGGGFAFGGQGATATKNHPTVATIPQGGIVEREVGVGFTERRAITMTLRDPDFTTADRIARSINRRFKGEVAQPADAGTITVALSEPMRSDLVRTLAELEALEGDPDSRARVILDERTGTVVLGEHVRVSTVAVSHGNLSIQIKEQPRVSQPLPFSQGTTEVKPDTQIEVKEQDARLLVVPRGVTIAEVVQALNAIGVTPRDLIAVFQAIRAAGALQAELEVL